MFSPFLDHFTDFYNFLSRFSPNQTGNPVYIYFFPIQPSASYYHTDTFEVSTGLNSLLLTLLAPYSVNNSDPWPPSLVDNSLICLYNRTLPLIDQDERSWRNALGGMRLAGCYGQGSLVKSIHPSIHPSMAGCRAGASCHHGSLRQFPKLEV